MTNVLAVDLLNQLVDLGRISIIPPPKSQVLCWDPAWFKSDLAGFRCTQCRRSTKGRLDQRPCCVPVWHELQDLLVASLFRNFLLAERIMTASNCMPVSYPRLPPTHNHPMWQVSAVAGLRHARPLTLLLPLLSCSAHTHSAHTTGLTPDQVAPQMHPL